MGMMAILFNWAEPFERIVNSLLTEGPLWNLMKIAQVVLEKKLKQKAHGPLQLMKGFGFGAS